MWGYENGFLAGLIAIILEDYGRRMVKFKFGYNNIVDIVSWSMLLDGPCSNARTINGWMNHKFIRFLFKKNYLLIDIYIYIYFADISQAIIDKVIGSFAL